MASSDRYGPLGTPEERARIEVIEDPVRTAIAAYKAWQGCLREDSPSWRCTVSHNCGHVYDIACTEGHYQEAARLLTPHAKLFAHMPHRGLEAILAQTAILSQTEPKRDDGPGESGIFLSALLNATDLPALDGVFHSRVLGYRLAPGKRLTVQRGSHICDLGQHAEGELLNHGKAHAMAWNARGGVQANYGTVDYLAYHARGGAQLNYWYNTTLMAGLGVTGGIQANFKEAQQSLAAGVRGGVQLNYGNVKLGMAPSAAGGVQANFGQADSVGFDASGGLQVNWGTLDGEALRGKGPDYTRPLPRRLRPALELRRKLQAFKRTVGTGDPAVLRTYDFKAFEAEVCVLGKEIMERQ